MAEEEPPNDDYEIVSISSKPFKSLPLFLPDNVTYNAETNEVALMEPATDEFGNLEDLDDPDAPAGNKLVLTPHAGLEMLQNLQQPLSCIACVGPYRTGKSLLLSRFLKDSKAFALGPTLEGCTKGIWISTHAIVSKETGHYNFLLDCEGAGDPLEGDEAGNARIALVCILISAVFMFNNTGRPDRNSLQFLSYLETIRQRIPSKESLPRFPSFMWVFRDFFLQLPKRKDATNRPYTLQEYMLERVLVKNPRQSDQDVVVESLLSDFQSFDVLSVGCPSKSGEPFTPEEMATLDDVEWTDFDEDFQRDVAQVITQCLQLASSSPFLLGHTADNANDSLATSRGVPARGTQFGLWCQQVLQLVNSNEILPNIPDMQEQLLQSLADKAVEKGIEFYSKSIWDYLNEECLVYNGRDAAQDNGMMAGLKGVAEEDELMSKSEAIVQDLEDELRNEIASPSLLESSLEKMKTQCVDDDKASILSKCQQENAERSRIACERLARTLYDGCRSVVRSETTKITPEVFESSVQVVEDTFREQGRGPAVQNIIETFLKEQREADRVFLDKVHGINALYKETLEMKNKLDEDVEEKKKMIGNLEKNLEETTKQLQAEMEQIKSQNKEAIKKLEEIRDKELADAESKRVADLKKKSAEMHAFKASAEQKLAEEIATRESQLKKEEETHKKAIEKKEKEQKEKEQKHGRELHELREDMGDKMAQEVEFVSQQRRAEKRRYEKEIERLENTCNMKCSIM